MKIKKWFASSLSRFALPLIAIAGIGLIWSVQRHADSNLRAELQQQARMVATMIDIEELQTLTGTAADSTSPVYLKLKEQLASIRSGNSKCRFVYLMGRKLNGEIFFFVDDRPVGDKEEAPAGMIYQDVPDGFRHIFDTGLTDTVGPFTDQWGHFVSGAAPIIDPKTGAVRAVLGLDVSATSWKRILLNQIAMTVGTVIALLIGTITFLIARVRIVRTQRPIMRRLLLPLSAMIGLILAATGAILYQQHQQQLTKEIESDTADIAADLRVILDQQISGLTLAAQPIAADEETVQAVSRRDFDRLLAIYQPVFKILNQQTHLARFSFIDTNLHNLLRIHQPQQRGDSIDRSSATEAARSGKMTSGIELDPHGNPTLRVVQPIFQGTTLIGYVELGKEMTDTFQALRSRSDNPVTVIIDKKFLDRPVWESEMRQLGRDAVWERLSRSVIYYSSDKRLPDALFSWADQTTSDSRSLTANHPIAFDGKNWVGAAIPFQDASGKEIGKLLVMRDISSMKQEFWRLMSWAAPVCLVLLTLLVAFIYLLIHRTDVGIRLQHEELQDSEARIRAITESAQDPILMMDPDGRISYWNPAAERLLGYTSTEAIGQDLHTLIVPTRYHAAHQAAFPTFQLTGQGAAIGNPIDLCAIRKDGSEISVQISLSALQLHGQWHSVGILRDITDRLRNEADLARLVTATERANRAKGEFLANMSHEIRTPMNGVIGMTGLLLETRLSGEQRHYTEMIRSSGESLLTIINDILDFSKIEASKLDLEILDFDLENLLDDSAEVEAMQAHKKGLEFICAVAPDVPTQLRGDPSRLRQVLLNLTSNAIKFTPYGEIALQASLVDATDDTVKVRFTVSDTGIGIPTEKHETLFDQFTQVDAATTRHYGGTGLGLAISKCLVNLMGGEIGCISELGQGSQFWFEIRFERALEAARSSQKLESLRGTHLLIVDDNATNREVLSLQLAAWGLRVQEASDGPTALLMLADANAAGDPFQIAILDMQMPAMDGVMLGRSIRADANLPAIRLILLTSVDTSNSTLLMQESGFSACLVKPARKSELLRHLLVKAAVNESLDPSIYHFGENKTRILIAEDNVINQKVALGILKRLGIKAEAVANGEEAVHALTSMPYDLVLMDMQMPVMDGLEATQMIRAANSPVLNPQIPIIAMTANAMQGAEKACLDSGMNDYLTKPVTPQSVAAIVRKWLPTSPNGKHSPI